MDRPPLTLANEIVNSFAHLVKDGDPGTILKGIPGLVKRVINDLSSLDFARGQLSTFEKIAPEDPQIAELKDFIEKREGELKRSYYREEIKGT